MVSNTIVWETDWEMAFKKARQLERPVLLDFFNPG